MPRSAAGKAQREQKLSAASAWKRGHTGGRGKGKFRGGGGGRGGWDRREDDDGVHGGHGGAQRHGDTTTTGTGYSSESNDPITAVPFGDAYQALLASLAGGDEEADDEFADALAAGQEEDEDEDESEEEEEDDGEDKGEDEGNAKSFQKPGVNKSEGNSQGSDGSESDDADADEKMTDAPPEPLDDDEAAAASGDEEDLIDDDDEEDDNGGVTKGITGDSKTKTETDNEATHGLAVHLRRIVNAKVVDTLKSAPFKFKLVKKFEAVRGGSVVSTIHLSVSTSKGKKTSGKKDTETGRWEFDETARGVSLGSEQSSDLPIASLLEPLPPAPPNLPTKLKERWNAVVNPVSYEESQKKQKVGLKQVTVEAKKKGSGVKAAIELEKAKIAERLQKAPPAPFTSQIQKEFYSVLSTYADITFTERAPPGSCSTGTSSTSGQKIDESDRRGGDNAMNTHTGKSDQIMDAYLLHAVAHVMRTRRRITKNNESLLRRAKAEEQARDVKKHAERVARAQQAEAAKDTAKGEKDDLTETQEPPAPYVRKNLLPGQKNRVIVTDDVPRDQGFARPTVLILVPMRNIAGRVVRRLLELCPAAHGRADAVSKLERFADDFGLDDELLDQEEDRKRKKKNLWVPTDHTQLFKGNTDDHFRLGVKVTKASVRLYVDFFGSDILIASPLGLATKLKESGLSAPDFLASIELLIVDNADVIAMQNWSHLQTVLDAINMIPKKHTDVDVMRVRENHLEGLAKHHRQTVFLSSYQSPEINALSRTCHNVAGRIKYRVNNYPGVLGRATAANGSSRLRFDRIPDVVVGVDEQSNQSGEGSKHLVALSDDARFKHFYKFTLPRLRENPRAGTVVFIPSYFDFVRVRNLLTETELSFAVASEYTPPRDAARARTIFADGRKRVLLVTERAHFYHRRKVKGVREVVFYGPPEHPEYFAEFVEFAASNTSGSGSNNSETTATCAFAKLDGLRLERIVGTQRAKKMLAPDANSAFVFTA